MPDAAWTPYPAYVEHWTRRPDKRSASGNCVSGYRDSFQIGRAHVWTPVTPISRMPSSAWKNQNVAAARALKRCWSPALTSALVTMMSSIRGIRWERRICCKCCIWGQQAHAGVGKSNKSECFGPSKLPIIPPFGAQTPLRLLLFLFLSLFSYFIYNYLFCYF